MGQVNIFSLAKKKIKGGASARRSKQKITNNQSC
jgi:hypothetical protein